MNGSTPDSEQLKQELEKLRLAKEVLAAERELELEAQRVTAERQAEVEAHAAEQARIRTEKLYAEELKSELFLQQQIAESELNHSHLRSKEAKSYGIGGAVFGPLLLWVMDMYYMSEGEESLIGLLSETLKVPALPCVMVLSAILGYIVGWLSYTPEAD